MLRDSDRSPLIGNQEARRRDPDQGVGYGGHYPGRFAESLAPSVDVPFRIQFSNLAHASGDQRSLASNSPAEAERAPAAVQGSRSFRIHRGFSLQLRGPRPDQAKRLPRRFKSA